MKQHKSLYQNKLKLLPKTSIVIFLAVHVSKVSHGVFEYIPRRIRNFICGWSDFFICAGREVLIKANAQDVPTYPMSCFKLPVLICKKMTTYISNFWWGSSIDNHKILWLKWNKLTNPKLEGCIGFEDMALFNQAMLGREAWMEAPILATGSLLKGPKGKVFP
jgi:hypothetical protein